MNSNKRSTASVRGAAALLTGTILAGVPMLAQAQAVPQTTPPAAQQATPEAATAPAATPAVTRTIRSLRVEGSQRVEQDTILSYTKLRIGQAYTPETVDQAIKDLYASELLADVSVSGVETGDLVVRVRENPIINRVVLEGNKRLKNDKIEKELKLKPRQIFTRTAVRADVARIVELYRRQGRFAAIVEPKMVSLDQNRVDVIFEIREGPKSKVRQINILGNEVFSDGELRKEMVTKESRLTTILSSNTSYDQDRLAYDQQKLRQFYLTNGYADFRVISAVAELTPDKRDFIITYVVEEGPRYKFGDVTVDSDIRDFDDKALAASLPMKKDDWYDAKKVEDSVESLSEASGLFGYAFAEVEPEFQRNRENLTMTINFHIKEANRTYIEKIDITGNTQTQDRVIRREMRLAEGDAFNTFLVKRSTDRINSLGYFQDKFEVEQKPGSAPDRIVLAANVEERATGELSLSAGFSSLERFILQGSVRQRNFRGKGQDLRASVSYSSYSKSVELGFTEPYLFDKNIALGATVFRRDLNAFNLTQSGDRNTTYSQVSTGFQLATGVPLTEFWTLSGRYNLQQDDVGLADSFFTNGVCNPDVGRYLCEAVGSRLTSSIGLGLSFDSLNSRLRPTAGQRLSLSFDFAGLGGQVRYLRGVANGSKFWSVGRSGFIFSVVGEGGYIHSLQKSPGPGIDPIRIVDRFYLGEPQFRGFDIRGVGPRVQRVGYTTDANGNAILITDRNQIVDDALGGRAYYLGRAELEIPLGAGAREMGLRPSIYVQAGALFGVTRPLPTFSFAQARNADGSLKFNVDGSPSLLPYQTYLTDGQGRQLYQFDATTTTTCAVGFAATAGGPCVGSQVNAAIPTGSQAPFFERFLGDSASPRLSIGIGVNWNSPFGPLRIDLAKALLKQPGDDTKLLTFNVGTQF
ncbi:outer membrane protein assembly factor BamA [Sphingomonas floccifaciens]|uniref:Outer membrane protein assembly factor BamA n=1 Tax=Sphingomonas floccifaciens TaxID=1844115 RepID=A0ABW4NFS4_9SPHN